VRNVAPVALVGLLLAPWGSPPAHAGDTEARVLLDEALQAWSDDPQRVLGLLASAQAAGPRDPLLTSQILLTQGCLHHTRTRQLELAEQLYDEALRELRGIGPRANQLRAAGLRRQGNLVVRRRLDFREGLRLFSAAYAVSLSGYDAEIASQLSLRLAQEARGQERERLLDEAWRLAQEATRWSRAELPPGPERREQLAKTWLQQALVLQVMGLTEEAARVLDAIPSGDLSTRSQYQRAIYDALAGDPDACLRRLRAWLADRADRPLADQQFFREYLAREPPLRDCMNRPAWAHLRPPLREQPIGLPAKTLGAAALLVTALVLGGVAATPCFRRRCEQREG
jgi:hypothetical protein